MTNGRLARWNSATSKRTRVIVLSTSTFTLLFAVWLMLGVLGVPLQKELGLSDAQLAWLNALAILSGSLFRLGFGILADRWGGRRVLFWLTLVAAVPCLLLTRAHSYSELVACALAFGLAGNAFSVGVAWCSAWTPKRDQGFVLGVFGAGNVGASITKLMGPALITLVPVAGAGWIPGGWRVVPALYAAALVVAALALAAFAPAPDRRPGASRGLFEMLRPLGQARVWRFSLYYVVVFGAYVALSVSLPKYYVESYGRSLGQAALLTSLFVFPASLLRPLGGWLSDRIGARRLMYWVLAASAVSSASLTLPHGCVSFTALLVMLGVAMGVGKAAVYRYVADYYPNDVGAVGGIVGTFGALGGFLLPPLFTYARALTGSDQSPFLVLLAPVLASGVWLHLTVSRLRQQSAPTGPASDALALPR